MLLYVILGEQLGRGRGRPPLPFVEIEKNCMILQKKGLDCVHLWVIFSFQNVALRVSLRKKSKIFPCGAFYFRF